MSQSQSQSQSRSQAKPLALSRWSSKQPQCPVLLVVPALAGALVLTLAVLSLAGTSSSSSTTRLEASRAAPRRHDGHRRAVRARAYSDDVSGAAADTVSELLVAAGVHVGPARAREASVATSALASDAASALASSDGGGGHWRGVRAPRFRARGGVRGRGGRGGKGKKGKKKAELVDLEVDFHMDMDRPLPMQLSTVAPVGYGWGPTMVNPYSNVNPYAPEGWILRNQAAPRSPSLSLSVTLSTTNTISIYLSSHIFSLHAVTVITCPHHCVSIGGVPCVCVDN